MSTNDHTVPQAYLKRFAELRAGKGYYVTAAPANDLTREFTPNVRNVAAVRGFYWASRPDGVDHHEVEVLLQKIEDAALPAFRLMLDDRDYALPTRWPLPEGHRVAMPWWMAAQVLRTTRQRARLEALRNADQLAAPGSVGRYGANHAHLHYMLRQMGAIAQRIYEKPWCAGLSDVCLLTSDVPVVILNGQDDPDQEFAMWFDDVFLPLDPHRFLLLPGQMLQKDDWRKRVDHRLKLDGGLGLFLNDAQWAAASRQVFFHPDHSPLALDTKQPARGQRLPPPGAADQPPRYVIEYGVLPGDLSVSRRWLIEHAVPDPS